MIVVVRVRVAIALTVLAAATAAHAQAPENVLVVINDTSRDSQRIGEYYAETRRIPPSNIVRLQTSARDAIERTQYVAQIEAPIVRALGRERLQDRILYLVLTRGIPLRIAGTPGLQGTQASVDSELSLLYRRMTGQQVPVAGRVANPYFLGDKPLSEARPFSHRDHDIFLVTRLDAFTADEAIGLVTRALDAHTEGQILLDQRVPLTDRTADTWLAQAADRLKAEGHGARVLLESTPRPAQDVGPLLGYYAWGSVDPQLRSRRTGLTFAPGAIAASFVSTDARTFQEPKPDWIPSNDRSPKSAFEGSSQSLLGDLIREGITGAAGHVAEPYLDGVVRPELLFSAYLGGFNLVEAFYLAIPHLSWQTIVVGDPLCAPFRKRQLTRGDLEAPNDPEMLLPGHFAARRLAAARGAQPAMSERAIRLAIRAESALVLGDNEMAREAFEQATAAAPSHAGLQLQLAMLEDQMGRHDAAIERYRKVLAINPKQPAALNNLAYALAVRRHAPAEALPLARQAVALAPGNPILVDTLAWIHHLLGDDEEAAKLFGQITRLAPNNASVRFHAAVAFAATGAVAVAEDELNAALKLDPSLADSEEARKVRAQIDALRKR